MLGGGKRNLSQLRVDTHTPSPLCPAFSKISLNFRGLGDVKFLEVGGKGWGGLESSILYSIGPWLSIQVLQSSCPSGPRQSTIVFFLCSVSSLLGFDSSNSSWAYRKHASFFSCHAGSRTLFQMVSSSLSLDLPQTHFCYCSVPCSLIFTGMLSLL